MNQSAAQGAPASAQARRDSRGAARRRRIFKSLHDCIIRKGYIKTTLADIAEQAGMSASHLLYYFKGKEDILEQYFGNVSVRFLERIDAMDELAPEEQIRALADLWFKGETSARREIGFMLECFGAAVHDRTLKRTKTGFDRQCKSWLRGVFEKAPEPLLGSPADAAEIAYSTMIGLRSAVYFDHRMSLKEAHRLFRETLLTVGGFKVPG